MYFEAHPLIFQYQAVTLEWNELTVLKCLTLSYCFLSIRQPLVEFRLSAKAWYDLRLSVHRSASSLRRIDRLSHSAAMDMKAVFCNCNLHAMHCLCNVSQSNPLLI